MDTLVRQAYENWHQVIEYDGKVLNTLTTTKNGKRTSVAPLVDNHDTTHYITSNNRQQQYISSEQRSQIQSVNNHTTIPQLIEFPLVSSDQNAVMTLNNQQAALASGGLDHVSLGTPGGGACFAGDWCRPRNGQGLEDFFAEGIRVRSSEMLESNDMQRLLKTFSVGVGVGIGNGLGHPDEACYSYSIQAYEPQMDQAYTRDHGRGSGKAVVGWLKLKAALRWGIFTRKRAAERRAQLAELD